MVINANASSDLDIIVGSVEVVILETGQKITYCNMAKRTALILCWLQYSRHNYNSWEYPELLNKHRAEVKVSLSGKTASLNKPGYTYCVVI